MIDAMVSRRRGKNELLRDNLRSKNIMIDAEVHKLSEICYVNPIFVCGLPTVEATEKTLASLDEVNALGPELFSTRVLKPCANVLTPILHMVILAIFKFGNGKRHGRCTGWYICLSRN